MQDELDQLRAAVARLETEVRELRAERSAPGRRGGPAGERASGAARPLTTDRRGLLRHAGAAAAGAVAGAEHRRTQRTTVGTWSRRTRPFDASA